jgi:hypothetical protein
MQPSTSVVRVMASVVAVAVVAAAAAGCAGSTDGTRRVPVGAASSSTAAPAGTSRSGGMAGATIPNGPTSTGGGTGGGDTSGVCAAVLRVEAGLVAGHLGLDDQAEPQDRAAVQAETARLEAQLPGSVARDLEVLARAYGAARSALDAVAADVAGPSPETAQALDQAVTGVTAPAPEAARLDLDRYLREGCS